MADLHPSERRLAETVLNFPGDMAGYSATEIAALAGVSNATVSRFVRKIGYASYDEARKAVREAGRTGSALMRFGASDADSAQSVRRHLQRSQANLDQTYRDLDIAALDTLVTALHAAPKVWLAGFRAAYPLASYLGWQIGQVLPRVEVIPRAGETLAESGASFGGSDILLLIGLRRAPQMVVTLAEAALAAGTDVAMIGDMAEPYALPVRWRIECATMSDGPLLNHTGVLAVSNLIATRTLETTGAEGRERMARIEDAHDRFREL